MNLRPLISVLFLSAAMLSPQIAHAQYGLSSSSNSNGHGNYYDSFTGRNYSVSDPKSDSHTGLTGPVSSRTSSSAGSSPMGRGMASGTANYGPIHAQVYASGFSGDGNASNTSRWFDTITVASPTLAYGSPVTLSATAHYTGSISITFNNPLVTFPIHQEKSSVEFQSDFGSALFTYSALLSVSSFGTDTPDKTVPIDYTMQQSINTYVGATLVLDSQVVVSASASSSTPKAFAVGVGSADSVFDIQSQTAGVTLVRASGFVAVPEPSAFVTVLLGAGMFGMVSRLRRRI